MYVASKCVDYFSHKKEDAEIAPEFFLVTKEGKLKFIFDFGFGRKNHSEIILRESKDKDKKNMKKIYKIGLIILSLLTLTPFSTIYNNKKD